MNDVLIWPIIFLMSAAALGIVFRSKATTQLTLALVGTLAAWMMSSGILFAVITHGTLVLPLGNWAAPFGISFIADKFSAVMLWIANTLGFFCIVFSRYEIDAKKIGLGFYPLMMFLLTGVNGAFLTGDLFNLYVWFEVLLISSFSLLTLGSDKAQIKGALPYVAINIFSSCLFLLGIGAIYGMTGSLNLAEISLRLKELENSGLLVSIAVLFIVAFGIKAAVFPLFFWLPISYHTPPVTVSAIFAGLLTKVAVYALIRFFTLVYVKDALYFQNALLLIAALTMIIGVLGAASQNEFRKILSFHIISQIGYMLMGLAFLTPMALAGTLMFIIHNIIVKSNLFLISGAVFHLTGSFELKDQGGLYRNRPYLSVLFLASAFSLAGLPPLSGFWGKLILAAEGLNIKQYTMVGISLVVGVLTLFSMTKIWLQTFWKPFPKGELPLNKNIVGYLIPITALAALSLSPAIYPEPIINFFLLAGKELMNPASYIQAVVTAGGRK
jgi:multicomponent Na+:H+ antiporter subunit D